MKKSFLKFSSLILGVCLCACNSEDDSAATQVLSETAEIEFSFDMSDITKSGIELIEGSSDTASCIDPDDVCSIENLAAAVYVQLHSTGIPQRYLLDLSYVNGKYVTKPLALAVYDASNNVTKHIVTDLKIVDSGALDDSNYYFSGIFESGTLAQYLSDDYLVLPDTIDMSCKSETKFKKCYKAACGVRYTPEEFGMVIPSIDFTKVTCIPYFINICAPCGEYKDEHRVAASEITVTSNNSDFEWSNEFTKTGEICFYDLSTFDDEDELFTITIKVIGDDGEMIIQAENVSLVDLLDWKNSWYYMTVEGAVTGDGFLHLNICDFRNAVGTIIEGENESASNQNIKFEIIKTYVCEDDCNECPKGDK